MLDIVFSHSYFYKFDIKQWNNKTPYPPLGTLYAASFLRESGYKIGLYDTNLLDTPFGIEAYLKLHKPKIFVLYDDGFNYLTKIAQFFSSTSILRKSNNCIPRLLTEMKVGSHFTSHKF